MRDQIAADELIDNRNPLMFKLEDYKVNMLTNHKILEFTDKGAKVQQPNGEVVEIEADTIITAFGMQAENELANKICDQHPNAEMIGDCNKVGQISGAVRGGFFAGWGIH